MEGCFQLGVCLRDAIGCKTDEDEAARLLKLGADAGHTYGQLQLGLCYEYGTVVEQDSEEATRLYRLAAEDDEASGLRFVDFSAIMTRIILDICKKA